MMDAGLAAQEATEIKWPALPYKGLTYFREKDAPLFTERDRDIRDCGMLVGQFSTRVLLLHGNSGSGKSSFLRAGLVPWLKKQHAAFYFLTDENAEPVFVRSTDDPVYQVHETLRVALERDPQLSNLESNDLKATRQELARPPPKDRDLLAKRVVNALSAIAMSLTPTLVLMIDQSEEVFSTGTPADEDKRREAFFNMLEELCYQKLPLKVIVVMRTEFYGRFSNALGILPRSNADNSDIGFRQYLLRDLQTKESLVNVIIRPTLDDPQFGPTTPRSVYGFTFAKGVPELLSDDLLLQFGETYPLPVLQIVCETLYRNVVMGAKRSEITADDYTSVGRAQGFMDKYIDAAITDALPSDDNGHLKDAIILWRHVLASLAGRQGSGSVTTLIATEQALVQTAEEHGIGGNIPATLLRMADRQLLRKVAAPARGGEEEPRFSLGHDALAASLCIWSEAWNAYEGQRSAAEKELERWRKKMKASAISAGLVLSCVVATSAIFLGYNYISFQNAILRRITVSTRESLEPIFTNKLLGLMAVLDSTDRFGYLYNREQARDQLRNVLKRSPRYGGTADATGIDLTKRKLAFLSADGTVTIRSFDGSDQRANLGKIPDSSRGMPSPSAAIGFVDGLEFPVVYKSGLLSAYIGTKWADPVDLNSLLPPEFRTGMPPFVDIAGGSIRAVISNPRDRTFNLLLVTAKQDGERVAFTAVSKIAVNRMENRYIPTISDSSTRVARIAPDEASETETLLLADMTTTDPAWRSLARMTYLNQQTGLNFARSISFAPNGQYVAVRYYQNELRLYSLAAPSSRPPPTIQLDNWPSSVPPNWPNLRPVMAAIETADSHWRIAWPTASGIVAGDGEYGGSLKPLEPLLNKTTDTLYSNSSDIMRLKFSEDGHFLASESKTFGRQATVQVWDLSAGRQAFIDSLTELDALRAEACSVAGITGPAELQQDDMYALFGQKVDQPCPRR